MTIRWAKHPLIGLALACCVTSAAIPQTAAPENQMGYQLLSSEDARALPRSGGTLGMDIEGGQRITSQGLTFELIRVKQVRRGSAGAGAGFQAGDQIIAVDGKVFPSLGAFASYIRSVTPGERVTVDYMPAGGGPQSAERAVVTLAGADSAATAPQQPETAGASGMSTRTKIGIAAVALFGCYELGCFKRHQPAHSQPGGPR